MFWQLDIMSNSRIHCKLLNLLANVNPLRGIEFLLRVSKNFHGAICSVFGLWEKKIEMFRLCRYSLRWEPFYRLHLWILFEISIFINAILIILTGSLKDFWVSLHRFVVFCESDCSLLYFNSLNIGIELMVVSWLL